MAPTGTAAQDWIWSNTSNVHVANNRDWFTTFTPFTTRFGSILGGNGTAVEGVSTVELDIKVKPGRSTGSHSHRKLVLHDVLYAPSCICNIFAHSAEPNMNIIIGGTSPPFGRLEDLTTGQCLGLLDRVKLFKLWLVGQPAGQSSLDPNGHYYINAVWSDEQRAAWKSRTIASETSFWTAEEKAYLKTHWSGEWHYLMQNGYNIHKDEDRKEARAQLRAQMAQDRDAAKPAVENEKPEPKVFYSMSSRVDYRNNAPVGAQ